ncbi:MAG: hypothetical protein NTZ25_00610 [Candidatus Peregrinibacteria bacterium]|nr:hypothetical protein [Candidatus Peregrinibacteria bacterium]
MKNTKQKLVSKIVCGFLIPLLLILNTGAAKVAYADNPNPNPGIDCTKDFPAGFGPTADGKMCQKANPTTEDACPAGFEKDAPQTTDTKLVCAKITYLGGSTLNPKTLISQIAALGAVQQGLNRLMWPLLVLIGGLMENDLLYGNGMEEKLRDIWIPIRNLVNILFVIVLVGLALYNVLGLSDDNTSIKSMLPKIVIGIIAVNFSFVAIKVVLDGINVLNTAIFALPDQVSEGVGKIADKMSIEEQARLCANFGGSSYSQYIEQADDTIKAAVELNIYKTVAAQSAFNVKGDTIADIKTKIAALDKGTGTEIQKDFDAKIAQAKGAGWCDGKGLNANGKLFLSHYNSRNAAFALALNMGKIVYYQDVDPKMIENKADGIEKIFTNTLFSMMLYIIYAASFIALFIVLMGRMVVMWLSIAVSPILLLMIASPQVKEKMGGLSKLSENFTKNAIAPLLISLSLTVGWIMLKAIQGLNISAQSGSFVGGSVLSANPSNGIPVAGLNTLQDIMVALGVIGVVWVGVFAAAEGTIAASIVEKLKGYVTSAGSFLGQLPFKHMPMFPVALPDHPHQHFTATLPQMLNTLEKIKNSDDAHVGDLSEKLGLNSKSADDLNNIHTKTGLIDHLKGVKLDNLKGDAYKKKLGEWIKNSENKEEFRLMKEKGTDQEKALAKQIELLATGTKEETEAAAAAIKNNPLTRDGSTAPTPDDGKSAAATPGIGNAAIGDKALGDKLKDPARIKTVNESSVKVDASLKKKGGPDKAAVRTAVTVIAQSLADATGATPQVDDIKTALGTNYTDAVSVFGGPKPFIDEIGKIKPTPKPADGAKPADGTTPPAAGGTQPPTPPAPAPGTH